jgi:hypothetical protein
MHHSLRATPAPASTSTSTRAAAPACTLDDGGEAHGVRVPRHAPPERRRDSRREPDAHLEPGAYNRSLYRLT